MDQEAQVIEKNVDIGVDPGARDAAEQTVAGGIEAGPERDKQILVLDYEKSIRMLLQKSLKPNGYTSHTAASAGQARDMMAAQSCDLVLCDILMPDGNGLEMLPKIATTLDGQVGRTMQRLLKKQGMDFRMGTRVDGAEVKAKTE